MNPTEKYFSVDIETAGPIPGEYDLLSIGACMVDAPDETFYAELKPFAPRCDQEALDVSGLSLARLAAHGETPEVAMARFADWIAVNTGPARPIFVGFNAPFDWSFINWYFHRFLGHNPFGFTALDIKAFYMGLSGCAWGDTSSSKLPDAFKAEVFLKHHSLSDAQLQAHIFTKMLNYRRGTTRSDFLPPPIG
ncbi:3'-5' exonuclease [Verrucomicrobiota bacterium sgz303538]